MLRGFDVSHHQGSENWPSHKTQYGITFGFAKATEGETFRDSEFPANWSGMAAADLVRGAYCFARPDADPINDALAFIEYVRPSRPTDLLVLDLETSDLGQDATNDWAKAWAVKVRQLAPGYVPGVYMGSGYLTNRTGEGLNDPRYFGWLWYPRYPSSLANRASWPSTFTPPPPLDRDGRTVQWADSAWGRLPDLWQFSATFPVGGQAHDANLYNGTLAQLRALNQEVDMATAEETWQYKVPDDGATHLPEQPNGDERYVGTLLRRVRGDVAEIKARPGGGVPGAEVTVTGFSPEAAAQLADAILDAQAQRLVE